MKLVPADAAINAKLVPACCLLLERAVKDQAFPGGTVAIGHQGRLAVRRFLGEMTYDRRRQSRSANNNL